MYTILLQKKEKKFYSMHLYYIYTNGVNSIAKVVISL